MVKEDKEAFAIVPVSVCLSVCVSVVCVGGLCNG